MSNPESAAPSLISQPSPSELEAEIAETATAPRVTLDRINAAIKNYAYFNLGEAMKALGFDASESAHLTTMCVLTLENDFQVIGHSACVSRENYREDIGRRVAYQKAIDQIWPLEGYLLKSRLLGLVS